VTALCGVTAAGVVAGVVAVLTLPSASKATGGVELSAR
jgi:hypothetical protein